MGQSKIMHVVELRIEPISLAYSKFRGSRMKWVKD